jgi:hypothetical protein
MDIDIFNMYALMIVAIVMTGCGLGLIGASIRLLYQSNRKNTVMTSDIEAPDIKLA